MAKRDVVPARTPPWLLAASVASLVFTLAFMMVLVVLATVLNKQVPDSSRFLVVIILALGAGFGAAGLGGEMTARGHLPIPGGSNQVLAVSAAGGIALFLIVLLMRDIIVPPPTPGPSLKLEKITGEETAQNPPRILLTANFDGLSVGPGQRLLLVVCKDRDCADIVRTERVDNPVNGTMLIFLRGTRESVKGARLVLETVSTSEQRNGKSIPVLW
jgi:hypothetical protein